jgi:hypothetical protein
MGFVSVADRQIDFGIYKKREIYFQDRISCLVSEPLRLKCSTFCVLFASPQSGKPASMKEINNSLLTLCKSQLLS